MKLRTISQQPEGSGEGTVGKQDYRKYYKGHMDKIKGEQVSLAGVGWRDGEKRQTTVNE